MTPNNIIDACNELVDADLGVLGARCPHCQGYFEIQPENGQLKLGYCAGKATASFEVAHSLTFAGLEVVRQESPPALLLSAGELRWQFEEQA
ncbi:hypothetical protein [Rhodocyclus tenuis]|uniref:Uncharacterized protein n=1 Tax=Rhodocyclus tenuis TaxID=1066 RepID=A0A840G1R0_RHOTE|nr:hypothetical protein [Rhodocyclus tenuis]MBB4246363.1 hypothetical protein [Rhodocyclus tenuis]MBK1681912.1 hypothetical protein [Rhodocyclus tenuis]